jgi:hypothetical protein
MFSSRDSVFFERLRLLRVWRVGNSCSHRICSVLASSSRRAEPGGQRVDEAPLGSVSHPGHISVGPNQNGGGSRDRPDCRKLPCTDVFGVDQAGVNRVNAIRPRRDVEAVGLTEIEEHRPGMVQQGEDPLRAVGGDQVEIGHAASEQRVSLAEVVMKVQTRHHREVLLASRVHLQQFGKHLAQGPATIVTAVDRGERHGVAQHAGTDWVPLGMVGIQWRFGS